MKTDRLLSITIYLMNHGIVSAGKLSELFEVSERTIQRDINALSLAGIPVYSQQGINGGYKLMENFTIQKQFVEENELKNILQSLIAADTALPDNKRAHLIEKIKTINGDTSLPYAMDFSSANENSRLKELNSILIEAINRNKSVRIKYISASGSESSRIVQPLKIQYKWYSWYLAAFCTRSNDFRIFKTSRICEINILEISPPFRGVIPDDIFERIFENDNRKYIDIKLECTGKAKSILMEYIPSESIEQTGPDTYLYGKTLPENERFWYGLLLSLTDEISIKEPPELIERLKEDCKKIIDLYKHDT